MVNLEQELFCTYSITARDPKTGYLGVAVQTHQMCVGANVPWLLEGVGVIATQALTNLTYGPIGLSMLCEGIAAPKVVDALIATDEQAHNRQVAVVDNKGTVAVWTGKNCIAEASHIIGEGFSVQANMMIKDTVVPSMADAYVQSQGDLAERMMAALKAAQREGGDIRGMQSAALKIVKGVANDEDGLPAGRAVYDLRVDEHDEPLIELERLVRLRRASLINLRGHAALDEGDEAKALKIWESARAMAPELEELGFWQAIRLADKLEQIQSAVEILSNSIADDNRKDHWIDLIRRLEACGVIEREGTSDKFIDALNEQ